MSDEDARVSRLPIALPFADKLFPAATFDMRKALAIHAKGITHVMQNTGHLSAKDRAYMMTAELFLMQHTCHWYCKSKTIASARMMARHQTPHEQLVNSVSEPTRKACRRSSRATKAPKPPRLQHDRTPHRQPGQPRHAAG